MMDATSYNNATSASSTKHAAEKGTRVFSPPLETESTLLGNTDIRSDLLEYIENANIKKKSSIPTHKRTASASHRRRHRPVHHMESISETGFGATTDNLESMFGSRRPLTVNGNDLLSTASTSSSSFSSVRRRKSNPISSAGSSSGSGSSSTRRRHLANQNSENHGNTNETQTRGNSSGLSASLDAGMKALRKWISARKFASNTASVERSPGQTTTLRLGEEDISALSRAGNDVVPNTTSASSISGESSSNVFEHGGNSGFLYYRPNEVHVVDDNDLVYRSDTDESSDLLFPLVNLSQDGALRIRAYSEPDRTQVTGFFMNSVYSSRAIDTGGARDETSAPTTDTVSQINEVMDATVSAIEEGNTVIHQEPDQSQNVATLQPSNDGTSLENDVTAESPGTFDSIDPSGSANDDNINNAATATETTTDPDRDARTRWLQINRRFRCIISSVAMMFSFLLVLFLISWVVMIATYVLSLPKKCDVPLRAYFWLATLQLAMDFFRAEIMKFICRWRSSNRGGIPLRVLVYNITYLIYAMLVLRLGITSVFVKESTCYSTSPEFFVATGVFVSLTLLAWTLIIVGYIIPYAAVAVLLTRNGYFPNELEGAERNRGRLLGILPNNLAHPAPPECIEKLRVVMYEELNDSSQKECCICLSEYEVGDGIVATPCDHIFHKQCCKDWLQLSRSCPICRRDVVEGINESATLEVASTVSDSGSHRRSDPRERRTSREWHREASNILQFLRRDQRVTAVNTSNEN